MTRSWLRLLQNEQSKPFERLYQGPVDPRLRRDRDRLSAQVEQLLKDQLDGFAPPFVQIEQAAGLASRLRMFIQIWLSLSNHPRKDLREESITFLQDLRSDSLQIRALLLNRISLGGDAPAEWVTMMRRRGHTILPWRAAIGVAEQPEHDVDIAWLGRFEAEQAINAAAGEAGIGKLAARLRATQVSKRTAAIADMHAVFKRVETDLETRFREAARLAALTQFNHARLDAQPQTMEIALKVAARRAPRLASRWYGSLGVSQPGMHQWHDRFADQPVVLNLATFQARERAISVLERLHPEVARAMIKLVRKGRALQPMGRGGGFTTPMLFDHKGRCNGELIIYAPFDKDVSALRTLVHEMGHGAHAYLSRRKGPLLSDAGWAVSEMIALSCETLLLEAFPHAHREQDFYMLVHQAAIARFERDLATDKSGRSVDDIWVSAMATMYGADISLTGYEPYWRRHTSTLSSVGYPTAYLLGWALAQHAARRRETLGEATQATYLDIMKSGSTVGFEDCAAMLGADDMEAMFEAAYDCAEERLSAGSAQDDRQKRSGT